METFSALLAICAGNSPVPGEFPTQRPVARGFDFFFDLRLNKRLSKQSWGWWLETLSCSLWRQSNVKPADVPATQGAMVSAVIVVTWFSRNIPTSVPEGSIHIQDTLFNEKNHQRSDFLKWDIFSKSPFSRNRRPKLLFSYIYQHLLNTWFKHLYISYQLICSMLIEFLKGVDKGVHLSLDTLLHLLYWLAD